MKRVNRKGELSSAYQWFINFLIFAAVLIVVFIGYSIITGKGLGAIEFFKNLLRFRR